jgi:hypothetical protein
MNSKVDYCVHYNPAICSYFQPAETNQTLSPISLRSVLMLRNIWKGQNEDMTKLSIAIPVLG